jgi:Integrase core domain
VLDRKFIVASPNQAWVGDLAYIATEEGWLFLAVVIDLFSRKVLGWSLRPDAAQSGDRCSDVSEYSSVNGPRLRSGHMRRVPVDTPINCSEPPGQHGSAIRLRLAIE